MDAHKNFAVSTVATAPSPATSGTSLVVATGEGARFPAAPFNATICPLGVLPTPLNAEIVRVTAISTDTLTIVRAQESTSARTVVVGDLICATLTAKSVTDIETDLASADTQVALQAAEIAAQAAGNLGYYVRAGLALSPNATPTKLDMAVGVAFIGTAELNVAAQAAISTTITSMADGTNPKWVAVELDTSGTVQFNQGTAAASPTFPTPTVSRVVLGWLWIPASATQVDTLLTTTNGLAKLIDARVVRPSAGSGWTADTHTWVFASATSFTIAGVDATGYLQKGTRVSWNDGTNTPGYGVVASAAFSTNTTVTLISTSDFPIANATITKPRYSYEACPQGYPTWFNWSPSALTGFSVGPTGVVYRWAAIGNGITIVVRQTTNGTSNNASHTLTLPIAAATITNMSWGNPCTATDNNVVQTGALNIASGASVVSLAGIIASANNTASGNSRLNSGQITYEF